MVPALAAGALACGSSASTNLTAPTASKCQVSLTNPSSNFGASGGSGTVTVSTARECTWSASASSSWVSITSGATGQGNGSIKYRVAANGDPVTRQAAIVVGDQRTSLQQDAAPCEYTVSAPDTAIAATGGQTAVDVRTHSACSWKASANASWVEVSPPAGQGSATVNLTALPNSGPERTVTLTIGPDTVVLRQLAPPPAPPAPNPSPAPAPDPTPAPSPGPSPSPTPTPAPNPPPAPDPTPAPPPPPPPAPNPSPLPTVELSGKVDHVKGSCPSVQFDLTHHHEHDHVTTSVKTDFQGGDCRDLKHDKPNVFVSGTRQADGVVTADVVRFEKR